MFAANRNQRLPDPSSQMLQGNAHSQYRTAISSAGQAWPFELLCVRYSSRYLQPWQISQASRLPYQGTPAVLPPRDTRPPNRCSRGLVIRRQRGTCSGPIRPAAISSNIAPNPTARWSGGKDPIHPIASCDYCRWAKRQPPKLEQVEISSCSKRRPGLPPTPWGRTMLFIGFSSMAMPPGDPRQRPKASLRPSRISSAAKDRRSTVSERC